MRRRVASLWAARRETGFALALLVVLLAINLVLEPTRFAPAAWGVDIGLAAPLMVAAIAAMPAILGGRGGIDVSIGPVMGLVNALVVQTMIIDLVLASAWVIVPVALARRALV